MLEAAQEEQDRNTRPELATRITNFKDYKSVIIGYPIWLGIQPMAINTFLESYDFTEKKVIPFCTSGGNRRFPFSTADNFDTAMINCHKNHFLFGTKKSNRFSIALDSGI